MNQQGILLVLPTVFLGAVVCLTIYVLVMLMFRGFKSE